MVADNLIDTSEASRITGLAVRSITNLCREGKIPARKIGRQYVVKAAWAEAEREKRTPPDGYITVNEAMKVSHLSRQRIHQLIKDGTVKSETRLIFERRLLWVERVSLEQWVREMQGE